MLDYTLFILGFLALIKGADWLVEGASSVALKFKIAPIVIGLTIVSFGTSAPELVVNITASITGNNDISMGNVIGSNICNILLILGIASLIYPLKLNHGTVWKEIPLALLAVIIMGFMVNDAFFDNQTFNTLSRIDGFALLSLFIIFIYYTFGITSTTGEGEKIKSFPLPVSVLMIVGGLIGLVIGGNWIVGGAVKIATYFGVSQALIGLTIVAIGTSLPELATSAVAAYKKNADIAVGNIVGSNIFNIFFILGTTATISPVVFNPTLNVDIWVTLIATFILFITAFIGLRNTIERWQGGLYLILFISYMVYTITRG